MTENSTDVTDMYAVHDVLRHEFAKLPITVKAVEYGNADRAAIVGGHVMLMTSILHAHHESEDLLLWPLLAERSPEAVGLLGAMESQHEEMAALVATAQSQTTSWMANPGDQERASLHTTLIALERSLLHHLATEEQEVMPIVARDLSQEEYAKLGEHSRAALAPEELPIALGLILDDTSADRGAAILASMSEEARAGFDEFGRPAYAAYKARLTDY